MFTTRPELKGTFGMVASTHWLASAAGMAMLERGGNAFDAAVCAAFVLQVVEPHLNGPGGDMPAILWDAKAQKATVLCAQGPAPAGATIEHYKAQGLDLVPGTGNLAAAVPQATDGWLMMLRDHGTLRLADVLEPAIGYAENGHPLLPRVAGTIGTVKELFKTEWTSSAATWLVNGEPPAPWSLHRNPALAETWKRLVREAEAAGGREAGIDAARRAWSEGFVAEAIDEWCRTQEVMDVSGRRHKGVLTADDMARFRPGYEAPLTYDYAGVTVAKCGPWSQGPMLIQQLALLKGFDIASMDPNGPEFVHVVTECLKLAAADRDAWYGDSGPVPLEDLLSDAYTAERRKLVGAEASMEVRPGAPGGRTPKMPPFTLKAEPGKGPAGAGAGEPTTARDPAMQTRTGEQGVARSGATGGDTCHIDVVDRWGNAVSATPSGGWLQSNPTIPSLGFCLGTRLQQTWLVPGFNSSLTPGRRPRTTLTPSMALKDGRFWMAFGTPGGDQQDQWQVPMLLRILHHKMDIQQAIDAPGFHTEHLVNSFWPRTLVPGALVVESRFDAAAVAELKRRGHKVTVGDPWSEGRLSAVIREERADGVMLRAGANPRGMQGYAVGR
ncbi:MAG TPA: gamma-glutamyltransferase family protein [Azospirillaceae bacterium]|nr:gamma-glutamyltransferase family protein [Azospirillaceae bacterium]